MKIAVCSLYINDWYREIVKYGKKTLDLYCEKHGYYFIYETEEMKDNVFVKFRESEPHRDIPWYKIKLLQKISEQESEFEFVVWIDADATICNPDITLESFIEKYLTPDKDILLGRDPNSSLNTGVMFIRNTEFSRKLLTCIWNNTDGDYQKNLHEQAALGELYLKNYEGCAEKMIVLDPSFQNEFLTYWYSYYPGIFIYHATRCAHDRKGFVFTIDMYTPIKMDEESEEQFQYRNKWLTTESECRKDIDYALANNTRGFPPNLISERWRKYIKDHPELMEKKE
jgi:hypothetical protein